MVRNSAADTIIVMSIASGSRRLRNAPAPNASPVSTGTPIMRNALKLYWSRPDTRCSSAPASGTVIRYPPENSPAGPHSCATVTGLDCRMTLARHVYQAGSRVGAEMDGSAMNFQPRMTNSSTASPAITHQAPRRLSIAGGVSSVAA